uniref:(northern house mosquito) hypothetical protein n=1 Tax=Culex pipiens TaxID=7175 RepID=A0A8D8CHH8_CULPI
MLLRDISVASAAQVLQQRVQLGQVAGGGSGQFLLLRCAGPGQRVVVMGRGGPRQGTIAVPVRATCLCDGFGRGRLVGCLRTRSLFVPHAVQAAIARNRRAATANVLMLSRHRVLQVSE